MKIFAKSFIISVILFLSSTTASYAISNNGMNKNANRPVPLVNAPTTNSSPRSCQARESAVKIRMKQLTQLATTMETTFNNIDDRVTNFYTNTVLSSGRSVANYSSLVNDISDKKTAVQASIVKTNLDIDNFSCTTGNPKNLLNQFRLDMQSVKTALKNYRTSIKNLIVAVNGVAETTELPTSPASESGEKSK